MSEPTESTSLLQPSARVSTAQNVERDTKPAQDSGHGSHEPRFDSPDDALKRAAAGRPLPYLNSTWASLGERSDHNYFLWRSRDNRKGRHVLIVPSDDTSSDLPPLSNSWAAIREGVWRMLTVWAWWDISWWIAIQFTVGCALFVISGFFHWLPLAAPTTKFPGETAGGGFTAFVGATLFAFAGILLVAEATNADQTGCFGWAVEQTYEQAFNSDTSDDVSELRLNDESSARVQQLVPSDSYHRQPHDTTDTRHQIHQQDPYATRNVRQWRWFPNREELMSHYIYEIGFLASTILAIGTIIFWVSGIMSIPQISGNVSPQTMLWTYWLAYFIGGLHFIASSLLYMLETQKQWYRPNFYSIGWWIGAFNLVGSIGWTMSASFGYCQAGWCTYQSHLSLLWASFAFLFGSLLLWYEALDKYSVERESGGLKTEAV